MMKLKDVLERRVEDLTDDEIMEGMGLLSYKTSEYEKEQSRREYRKLGNKKAIKKGE
jgi:hypothetical protein